jgi:hypothetical protein
LIRIDAIVGLPSWSRTRSVTGTDGSHGRLEEAIDERRRPGERVVGLRPLPLAFALSHHRQGVGARDPQGRVHAGLVANLDEKRAPALLEQPLLHGPLAHLDAALGVDRDEREAQRVERFLHVADGRRVFGRRHGGVEPAARLCGQRIARHFEGLGQPAHARHEGLPGHVGIDGQRVAGPSRGRSEDESRRGDEELPARTHVRSGSRAKSSR